MPISNHKWSVKVGLTKTEIDVLLSEMESQMNMFSSHSGGLTNIKKYSEWYCIQSLVYGLIMLTMPSWKAVLCLELAVVSQLNG